MFEVGEYIVYGCKGVCQVEEITHIDIPGSNKDRLYYVLAPLEDRNGKIYDTRLSNGPIESLNRKVKDLKRLGRGFRNFEHFRNRFLYATRALPVLNGVSDYNPVSYLENDEF